MSGVTLRQKVGLILAVAVFALGMTAAVALGWENEQTPQEHGKNEQDHGKNKKKGKEHGNNEEKGKEHGNNEEKGNKGNEKSPPVTTPQTPAPVAPTGTTPAPVGPAAPTSPQGAPSQPPSPVGSQGAPEQPSEQGGGSKGGGKEVAQSTPSESAPLAPVAEQRKLARTGLNPALIALLGALCLGGGAFLFRRGLAR
jgi:hypothetical protein